MFCVVCVHVFVCCMSLCVCVLCCLCACVCVCVCVFSNLSALDFDTSVNDLDPYSDLRVRVRSHKDISQY